MPVLKIKRADGSWQEVWGAVNTGSGGGGDDTNMFMLVDQSGKEVPAVVVDQLTMFDATADDIKLGKVAANDDGIVVGTHVCD